MTITVEAVKTDTKTQKKKTNLVDFINSQYDDHQLVAQPKIRFHKPQSGVNPIVDAAAPIFAMVQQSQQANDQKYLKDWGHQFVLAINEFQQMIKVFDYNSEALIGARYAMCALIDDVIQHSPLGVGDAWAPYAMLTQTTDEDGKDRFFGMLERLMIEPEVYIDVLELYYLTLSTGYKGVYRGTTLGIHQLNQLTNNLYEIITRIRGEMKRQLSDQLKSLEKVKETWFSRLPMPLIAAIGGVSLLFLSIGFYTMNHVMTHQISGNLTSIGTVLA